MPFQFMPIDPSVLGNGNGSISEILTQLMNMTEEAERPAGASQHVIDRLERVKWDKTCTTDECPVCQDEYTESMELVKLPCSHLFHPDCVIGWLKVRF